MPNGSPASRTIRGTLPTKTGSYTNSTKPQLQGKGSNKTAEFLAAIEQSDPGRQAFYREALQVPHPLETGKQITYGQLQQLMNGPQKGAALEAYRNANKLPSTPTAEAYQQAAFDAAHKQLIERGANDPSVYAFPDAAAEALRAPTRARLIRTGNFATGEQSGQAVNPAMLAQRAAELPADGNTYAAPGMPVRLIRSVTPPEPPTTAPRTIRAGTYASR
jgi:hypothetical protein